MKFYLVFVEVDLEILTYFRNIKLNMDVEDEFSLIIDTTGHVPGDPTGHVPGDPPPLGDRSIHDQESIRYHNQELKADQWVLETLAKKHHIPFRSRPTEYYEKNNKSADAEKEVLWAKFVSWEKDNYVTRVKERPRCTSPMSVVIQPDFKTGKVKKRPCLDLSRHVNSFIVDTPVSISHLSAVEDMLEEGDYQTLYDLENMYFQIVVAEEDREFLGCEIEDPSSGESHYFVFNVLIYGLKHAVAVVTKLTKPIIDKVNSLGIRNSILIDDGRILSSSPEEGVKNHTLVLKILQDAGWRIQWAKTDGKPSQTVIYQGLVNCTSPMKYFLPDYKKHQIITQIDSVHDSFVRKEPMKTKDFASVLGKINAGYKALGPVSRILLRSSYSLLASIVQPFNHNNGKFVLPNWNTEIAVSQQIMSELLLLKSQLHMINGQPILTLKTGITLDKILEKVTNKANLEITHSSVLASQPSVRTGPGMGQGVFTSCSQNMNMKVFASDSSDTTEFAFNVEEPGKTFEASMSEHVQILSSGHRELKSVLDCVQNHPEYFVSELPVKVYWLLDSQNLYSWLKRGSKKPLVQNDIFQLFLSLSKLNVCIEPVLVPRDHVAIALADYAGKFKNTDCWSIDDVSFQTLQQIAQTVFTCDVFAHSFNARCVKFYSQVPSFGTAGINAFTMDWSEDYNFVCPPVKEIVFVVRHILAKPCAGVLVVPFLPSARFWHFLTSHEETFLNIFRKSHIFCPDLYPGFECQKSSFSGPFNQHNKKFIALFFDST